MKTSPQLQMILDKLENVKQAADGFTARCPAHDDQRNSLSIGTGEDGRALLFCHAGCTAKLVCAALGLQLKELFPDSKGAKKKIVNTYDYTDEHGQVVYQKVRYKPKDFRCRIPDGKDGWTWNMKGVRRVLYNLPAVIASEVVFIAEGEKDCDLLTKQGYAATCNYDGAGKWDDSYNSFFKDKVVNILPDNDTPGKRHAANIYRQIVTLTKDCRIVELPGLPDKGDVSDFFANGGTKEQFDKTVAAAPDGIPAGWTETREAEDENGLQFACFADIEEQPLEWLWPNRLPIGTVSLIVGNPNAGKTFVTCSIISLVTRGKHWPDCANTRKPGRVLFFGEEDSIKHILKPRIRANGGDCTLLHGFECVKKNGKEDHFSLTQHLELLERKLDEFGDVALVVFDPITAYLPGINANDNAEVRSALIGLQRVAQKKGITMLGVSHLSKKTDLDAIHRPLGSVAFVAAARSVWAVGLENRDGIERRVFVPVKSNYSMDVQGLAFDINDGVVVWQAEAVEQDANSIMRSGRVAAEKDRAKTWLRNRIGKDAILGSDIVDEARAAGFSEPTIQRAATELGVVKKRSKPENRSVWSLCG